MSNSFHRSRIQIPQFLSCKAAAMSEIDLYKRSLLPKGFGLPVFSPQPSDDQPDAARRFGTQIGDVVVVTSDGSVDPIFNILRAAGDPANRFGVPFGFEQVVLSAEDVRSRVGCHPPGSVISNTNVHKKRLDLEVHVDDNIFLPVGAGAAVELSTGSAQMVVLVLPEGASSWDLRPHQVFRDYALKHSRSWYAFVNGTLHRMVPNGGLYLVTGITKSSSWHIAAAEASSSGTALSLRLKAAMVAGASASCAWAWETVSSAVHSGPSVSPGEEEWRDNQTLFIRGCKIALGSALSKSPKVMSLINSKAVDVLKTTAPPFSRPRPGTSRTNSLSRSFSGIFGTSDSLSALDVTETCPLVRGLVLDSPVGDAEWDSVPDEEIVSDVVSKPLDKGRSQLAFNIVAFVVTWLSFLPMSHSVGASTSSSVYQTFGNLLHLSYILVPLTASQIFLFMSLRASLR
ncbi:hypothetical protein FB45DRAFT_926675 [Roridomyces roridus]|uniref:Uncharacterized protein n=1 Tax=Roridomyces roridus TaxID=1738132 RepID=A0AAD7FJN4_9AGAR|nr:hypothetical protein FB45DRAFT_926675 [Roridomyces roridus]